MSQLASSQSYFAFSKNLLYPLELYCFTASLIRRPPHRPNIVQIPFTQTRRTITIVKGFPSLWVQLFYVAVLLRPSRTVFHGAADPSFMSTPHWLVKHTHIHVRFAVSSDRVTGPFNNPRRRKRGKRASLKKIARQAAMHRKIFACLFARECNVDLYDLH